MSKLGRSESERKTGKSEELTRFSLRVSFVESLWLVTTISICRQNHWSHWLPPPAGLCILTLPAMAQRWKLLLKNKSFKGRWYVLLYGWSPDGRREKVIDCWPASANCFIVFNGIPNKTQLLSAASFELAAMSRCHWKCRTGHVPS